MTGKPVVAPINIYKLSFDDEMEVLEAVNMMEEKRCGKIKGRTCVDDSKQQNLSGVGSIVT